MPPGAQAPRRSTRGAPGRRRPPARLISLRQRPQRRVERLGTARAAPRSARPTRAPARSAPRALTVAATAASDVRPDAGRNAAENRGAERGALVDRDALERQLEHRGDDLQPQLAARAAARHAPERRAATELVDQIERVAKAERYALEHRAHERAAVVAQLEPDERPARVRVGVRRTLAREVGQENQALGPGRPAPPPASVSCVVGDARARRRRAASAATRRPRASRPSRARRPGPRGRRRARRACGSAA